MAQIVQNFPFVTDFALLLMARQITSAAPVLADINQCPKVSPTFMVGQYWRAEPVTEELRAEKISGHRKHGPVLILRLSLALSFWNTTQLVGGE
jgi:hypothetical protein